MLLGGLVAAAMVGHQIFGVSTTYAWVVDRVFFPHAAMTRRTTVAVGWEPLSDVGVVSGSFAVNVVAGRFQVWLGAV